MAQTGQRCSRDRVPGRAVGPLKHPEGPGLPLGDLGREAQRTARCPNERSGLLGWRDRGTVAAGEGTWSPRCVCLSRPSPWSEAPAWKQSRRAGLFRGGQWVVVGSTSNYAQMAGTCPGTGAEIQTGSPRPLLPRPHACSVPPKTEGLCKDRLHATSLPVWACGERPAQPLLTM